MNTPSALSGYTDAITSLPEDAFLGSLLFFTITNADVNLTEATKELQSLGLSLATLRKRIRPVDAFNKATREFAHKFKVRDGVKAEIMVRPVGADGEQVHRHIVLERTVVQEGKRRRIAYDKIGEMVFNRGELKNGEYSGYSVAAKQTTELLGTPLNDEEEGFLVSRLETLQSRFDHLVHYMDSHAVRTFVRGYIYNLSGILVRESGGLYFVRQSHAEEIAKLQTWVQSIGSDFHSLPLLNLVGQREMIMEAFEEDTIGEVGRLMGELNKILSEKNRTIDPTTFEAYSRRAIELSKKVEQYNDTLGARADRAEIEIQIYKQQVLQLSNHIRQPAQKVRLS